MFTEAENKLPYLEIDAAKADELLKLDNQLCFALYVCSKEMIKKYRPFLEPLGLTYTGYITMLALWEYDSITVKELGKRLYLDSGTLTPLLKKLELQNYITRTRSQEDERNVYVHLTEKGINLKSNAVQIPLQLLSNVGCGIENGSKIISQLHQIMKLLMDAESNNRFTSKN